ncbi:hypothetical protein [Streptomyces sp. NPDC048521]|uniref:hypothetical protein n=1 Tax=Streptomyces sp. NPDC048521 TaxID=3365566 RepID=UPI0037177602
MAETEQTMVLSIRSVGRNAGAPGFPKPSGALRDPWGESARSALDSAQRGPRTPAGSAADPTHDPHEVTVQLDAVQLGDVRLSPAAGAPRGSDADGPVFVDESGRRSRRFRLLGVLVAVACTVFAVVIVATLMSGSSDAPWLPVPGQNEEKPASQIDTSPLPSTSNAATPGTGAATGPAASPTARPTAGGGAGTFRPQAGTSADGPAAGTSAETSPVGATEKSPSASAPSTGVSPDPSTPTGAASSVPAPPASGGTGTPTRGHPTRHPKITL